MGKKILKYILWIAGILVALFFILLVSIYLPPVQNLIKRKAADYFSSNYGIGLSVDRFRLRFPAKLTIDNATVISSNKDTLVHFGKLEADAALLPLLRGQVALTRLDLADARLNYRNRLSQMELNGRIDRFSLSTGIVDLRNKLIDVTTADVVGGSVFMTQGEEAEAEVPPDTIPGTPAYWKIRAGKLHLDNADFAMHTRPPVTELYTRLDEGDLWDCSVDLKAQSVRVKRAELKNGTCSYLTDKTTAAGTEQSGNSPDTTNIPWTVEADHVTLTGSNVRYGAIEGTPAGGLDLAHLQLTGLDLQADSFYNRGNHLKAVVGDLRFRERSGLEVTSMTARFEMDSTKYSLRDFRLTTPHSSVRADFQSGAPIARTIPGTPLQADITGSIGPADLSLVFPRMDDNVRKFMDGSSLSVRAVVSGEVGNIDIHAFSVSMPRHLTVAASGHVESLFEPGKTSGRLQFNGNFPDIRFLKGFIRDTALQNRIGLPPMTLRGEVNVSQGTFQPSATLSAGQGYLSVNGSVNLQTKIYQAEIKSNDFPLHLFLPNDSLGILTMALTARGRGFDPLLASTASDINLHVDRFDYKGYAYTGVSLVAGLDGNRLDGMLGSDSDALRLALHFNGNLTKEVKQMDLQGTVKTLDLYRMNLAADTARFSLLLDASATFRGIGDFAAKAALDSMRIDFRNGHYYMSRSTLTAAVENGAVQATLHSGDLAFDFRSATRPDSLINSITRSVGLLSEQIRHGDIDMEKVNNTLPAFHFQLTAGKNNILHSYLKLQGIEFNSLSFASSSSPTTPFDLKGSVNRLYTRWIEIDTVTVGISRRDRQLAYFLRLANRPGNISNMGLIYVYGNVEDSRAVVNLLQRNRQRETGFHFGLEAAFADNSITARMIPENPVFGFDQWHVNPDNFLTYHFNREMYANLRLSYDDQYFNIVTNSLSGMPPGAVRLNIGTIDIGNTLAMFPVAPPIKGTLSTDIALSLVDNKIEAKGNILIGAFGYDDLRIGDIGLDTHYRLERNNGPIHRIDATLSADGQKAMVINGVYAPADSVGVDMTADISGFPLALVNPMLPGEMLKLSGALRGNVKAVGPIDRVQLSGGVRFTEAAVDVPLVGTTYRLSEETIPFENSRIVLDNFAIIAPNNSRLLIDGNIDAGNFSDITTDIFLEASDFQVVNVPGSRGTNIFGTANIDLDAHLSGPFGELRIDGGVELLRGSNLTYVLQSSPLNKRNTSQEVVTFVSFSDTAAVNLVTTTPSRQRGMNILMDLIIAERVNLSLFLSEDGQNRVDLEGGGTLTYTMNPLGDSRLTGRYELSGGTVRYNPPIISQKTFAIKNGSFIEWTGEMTNPLLSIEATETINATATLNDNSTRRVSFEVSIIIRNTVENLEITFDLAAPNDLTVQNEISSLTDEQRAAQAMSLMLYNSYTGPGITARGNTSNTLNAFLTRELNRWAEDVLRGVDLSFGIETYSESSATGASATRTNYSYRVSKRLFSDRVRVEVGGRITTSTAGQPSSSVANNLVDDISVEYTLSRRENMFVKLFRHTNYLSILEGEVTETGVGFVVRKKMDRLNELFRSAKGRERRQLRRQRKEQEKRTEEQNDGKNSPATEGQPQGQLENAP